MSRVLLLSEDHENYLANKPEAGMGYQVVTLILIDGEKHRNRVVLDACQLVLGDKENLHRDDIQEVIHQPWFFLPPNKKGP